MPEVDPGDVSSLTEGDVDTITAIVSAIAKGYTRGRGFDGDTPVRDVAAVIVTASARLAANPEQIAYDSGAVSMRGGFNGWTLAEQIILNRYRVRAQ